MKDDMPHSIYDLECVDLGGNPLPFAQFRGKPLLIVNTASLCGYSRQYKGLETLWQQYRDKGFVIIGVPSNDFGRQEPGNSAAIAALCSSKFGVTFPFIEKTVVIGRRAHPLFKWIAEQGGILAGPHWNFYKYLVGRDGQLKDWFTTWTKPTSERFERAVDEVVTKG